MSLTPPEPGFDPGAPEAAPVDDLTDDQIDAELAALEAALNGDGETFHAPPATSWAQAPHPVYEDAIRAMVDHDATKEGAAAASARMDAILADAGADKADLIRWIRSGVPGVPDGPGAQLYRALSAEYNSPLPEAILLPAGCDPVTDAARIRQLVDRQTRGRAQVETVVRDPRSGRWQAVLGAPTARPQEQVWTLGDTRAADLDRLAQVARDHGVALVAVNTAARTAAVAALDPYTEYIRARLAGMLGTSVRPWDIEIQIEWRIRATSDGQDIKRTAEPAVVHVLRMPTIADPEKRRATWVSAVEQLLPCPPNTNWWADDDSQAGQIVIRRAEDPLGETLDYPWESAPSYRAIPWGIDVEGKPVSLGLLESNILIGGIPGSGKSGSATALLAGISRLPHTALVGLDPKVVELAGWEARFSRIATEEDDATVVLRAVRDEMDRRYHWLKARALKKLTEKELSDEMPLIVLHIDELADLVSVGVTADEKAAEAERSTLIRRLIAKGRAAGLVVITATQKPQSDVVPTALRDLIQQRVGHATTTPQMTETILGSGMAQTGGLAHEIPSVLKGVAYLVNEGSRTPVRARAYWIPDEDVSGLAAATAHLRVDLPWMPEPGEMYGAAASRRGRRPAAKGAPAAPGTAAKAGAPAPADFDDLWND